MGNCTALATVGQSHRFCCNYCIRDVHPIGEGSYSKCFRGIDEQTGLDVAIKEYKRMEARSRGNREVGVLLELQKAFSDPSLPFKPSEVFVQMLDYSRDTNGEFGFDPLTGRAGIVMELASCSLKELLVQWSKRGIRCGSDDGIDGTDFVKSFALDMTRAIAGLHAKGLVHLDLKPANFLLIGNHLKLSDVDGCVRTGARVSIDDPTVSFSPIYCAPQWAHFVIDKDEHPIIASTALDAWSLAMTICELVTLEKVLAPRFKECRCHTGRFLHWLEGLESPPVPPAIQDWDVNLYKLLCGWLAIDDNQRRAPKQGLGHAYFSGVLRE